MKITTDFFKGKKPSLEEGKMIYTVSDEENLVAGNERTQSCIISSKPLKIILYVLLFILIMFFVWILFASTAEMLPAMENRRICESGLFRQCVEGDNGAIIITEVEDMLIDTDSKHFTTNDDESDAMAAELSQAMDEGKMAIAEIMKFEETKEYLRRLSQMNSDAKDA